MSAGKMASLLARLLILTANWVQLQHYNITCWDTVEVEADDEEWAGGGCGYTPLLEYVDDAKWLEVEPIPDPDICATPFL